MYSSKTEYFVRVDIKNFLSSADFENILSSGSIEQALRLIAEKAVGLYLYSEVRGRKPDLNLLFKLIDRFEALRFNTLLGILVKERDVYRRVSVFIRLFDVINSYTFVSNILNKKEPAIFYPVGFYSRYLIRSEEFDENDLKTMYSLAPRHVKLLIEKALMSNKLDFDDVVSSMPTINDLYALPYRGRVVYGVYNDLYLLKHCLATGSVVEPNTLVLFSRDEYYDLCRQSKIEGLINMLSSGNVYARELGSILSMMKNINSNPIIIDAASIIYSAYKSRGLIDGVEDNVIRYIVLSIGEGFLLRSVLNAVVSGLHGRVFEEVIRNWWPL